MRGTVEIEPDLAAKVEAVAKSRGLSVREFVSAALRQAIAAPAGQPAQFVQKAHDFGVHLECPWTILADMETEEYVRRFARK